MLQYGSPGRTSAGLAAAPWQDQATDQCNEIRHQDNDGTDLRQCRPDQAVSCHQAKDPAQLRVITTRYLVAHQPDRQLLPGMIGELTGEVRSGTRIKRNPGHEDPGPKAEML